MCLLSVACCMLQVIHLERVTAACVRMRRELVQLDKDAALAAEQRREQKTATLKVTEDI
jgi:hypothetical protein